MVLKARVRKRRSGALLIVIFVMAWPFAWAGVAVYRTLRYRRPHVKVDEREPENQFAISQLRRPDFVQTAASQTPKAFSKANSR